MLRSTLLALSTCLLAAQTPPAEAKKETPKPATEAAKPAEAPKPEIKIEEAPAAEAVAPQHAHGADCNHGEEAKKADAKPATPAEDKVLARVNHKLYRDSDFEAFLNLALNPQQRMQMEMTPGAKDQYRQQFLDLKVMEARARQLKMDSGEDYRKQMEVMEMQTLVQALVKQEGKNLQDRAKITDEDIKAYYESHHDDFRTKETFDARHILISVKSGKGGPEEKGLSDEEAKAKVAKIQADLKAGKSFADLAKEHTDDPGSKEKGGLYENITFGSFVPEFDQAVRTQELGKVGEPVKTRYGYHLIVAEKIDPAIVQPFEVVKEQARQKATQAKQDSVFKAFIDELKKDVPFVAGEEAAKETKPGKGKAAKATPKPAKAAVKGAK